jgi:hypothetical protein
MPGAFDPARDALTVALDALRALQSADAKWPGRVRDCAIRQGMALVFKEAGQ